MDGRQTTVAILGSGEQTRPLFHSARWICDPVFLSLPPRPLRHKQRAPSVASAHRDDLVHRHLLTRGSFSLAEVPVSARLLITADDHYRLWINGAFAGIGPAPGYPDRTFCNDLEVASFLVPGRNVIAVHVYYQGLVNRVWFSGDHRQGMIAELTSEGRVLAASGEHWRAQVPSAFASAGITGYATQVLERFDSRDYDPAWRARDFDDGAWASATLRGDDDHRFVRQPTLPLAVHGMAPHTIEALPGGGLRLDFGGEITAGLALRARGAAGDRIELRFGEELLPDGRVRHAMRCNCDYRDEWILSGRDDDELEQIDYKGFRYAEILAADSVRIDVASIRAVVRHHPMPDAFAWASSEPGLDAIVRMCARTVRYGAQDGMLDCPTREKGQYLGDLTISGAAHLYVSGDLAYARKCMMDFAHTSVVCPGLMAVAPCSFMQEIADYSLQWPLQLLRYYRHSGDLATVREAMPALRGLMRHFSAFQRADGLIADVIDKWNLVDWPANLRDDYDFPLTDPTGPGMHAAINAFWIMAIEHANALADIAGIERFQDADTVREGFRSAFYRPGSRLFVDAPGSGHASLHTNALALCAGAAPAGATAPIVEMIARKRLSCGVYMAYFVLKALGTAGAHQLVYDLLVDDGERSWSNMLREGATTCFEAWGKDQKWNTSLCHPWACAPIPILVEDLLGLSPLEPGWRGIVFRPRLPVGLRSLSLRILLGCGEVTVVHRDGRTSIQAPEGVEVVRS